MFLSVEHHPVLKVFHRLPRGVLGDSDQLPQVRQDRGQEPQLARQRGQTRAKTRSVDK